MVEAPQSGEIQHNRSSRAVQSDWLSCQGAVARDWLAGREVDLLPVGYVHVVFTQPTEIADPRHLGARIGITEVLYTWGSALSGMRLPLFGPNQTKARAAMTIRTP